MPADRKTDDRTMNGPDFQLGTGLGRSHGLRNGGKHTRVEVVNTRALWGKDREFG